MRQAQDSEPGDPFAQGLRTTYNQLQTERRAARHLIMPMIVQCGQNRRTCAVSSDGRKHVAASVGWSGCQGGAAGVGAGGDRQHFPCGPGCVRGRRPGSLRRGGQPAHRCAGAYSVPAPVGADVVVRAALARGCTAPSSGHMPTTRTQEGILGTLMASACAKAPLTRLTSGPVWIFDGLCFGGAPRSQSWNSPQSPGSDLSRRRRVMRAVLSRELALEPAMA